ncbi:hypothetical protein DFH27DRAFT_482196 [Peziza echinospora]|nr:hypothetical protein DFH27DRAFT_482196 [Peziza echinospora]
MDRNQSPGSERISIAIETPPPTPPFGSQSRHKAGQLPTEIVMHILSFVPPNHQKTFASCCLVSRQWYHVSVSHLYARPLITTGNYEKFVNVICPSVTNIKHSPLAEFIRSLDLSHLAYDGKSSYTARLLRRTNKYLEEFFAPQTQFGYACLVALGQCLNLRVLDLKLVSQALSTVDLFQHIAPLPKLRSLTFPRSMLIAGDGGVPRGTDFELPPALETLTLTGGVSDTFLMKLNAPPTLTEFHISHLSFARHVAIQHLINRLSNQLTVLEVNYYIARLPHNAMDKLLVMCPHLVKLIVAVDFITSHFFDDENAPSTHPLKQLDLDSSGFPGAEHKVKPDDIYICLAGERLPALRIMRINKKLGWMQREEEGVRDLVDLLEIRRDSVPEEAGDLAGVWEFGTLF